MNMNDFPYIPTNKKSLLMRKSLCGVGINDAWYMVCPKIDGKKVMCPFYRTWSDMLRRCYDSNYHAKHPTYIGCTVCEEWLTFSNFKAWMKTQDWEGKALDKDIITPNNKHYSPDTCVFVSRKINNLLVDRGNDRGEYPIGVYLKSNKYYAQCSIGTGRQKHLGVHDNPEDASKAYKVQKEIEFHKHIAEQTDPRIINGLYLHLQIMLKS